MTYDKCPICGYKMTASDGNICPECLYSIGGNPTTDNKPTANQQLPQDVFQQNYQQMPKEIQQEYTQQPKQLNPSLPQHDARNAPGRQRRIILIIILVIFAVICNLIYFIVVLRAEMEMAEYENNSDSYYEYYEYEQGVTTDC